MAKRDIPFERFYYVPRLRAFAYRPGEHGEHFEEMKKVDSYDLQSLSQYELDIVPIGWLFDWAKITGDIEFAEQVYNDRQARGIK